MRRLVSPYERSVTGVAHAPTLAFVFRTELTKRRAIDLARVAGMLCPMP